VRSTRVTEKQPLDKTGFTARVDSIQISTGAEVVTEKLCPEVV